jgi:hypothetical protein
MKWIIAACAVFLLAGCITKPPRPDQLREPSPDRLLAYQAASDGDANIVVTRDVGFAGSGCYTAVFIDGKVAAKLATGERVTFYVPSGPRILGAWNTGAALCGYREGEDRKEVDATVKPGETRKFRITINPNAGIEINPTTL